MNTLKKVLLVIGCGLLLPVHGAAQTRPAGEPADTGSASAERLAVAREIIRLLNVQEAAGAGVQIMLDQQMETNPELRPHRKVMEDWAREIFGSAEAELAFARIYAETFSVAELQQIRTFYLSPVGRRLAAEQRNLALRGADVGRRLAEENLGELLQRIQANRPAPPGS